MSPIITKSIETKKEPMVLLTLKAWQEIEERLEDLEALASPRYLQRIARSRKEAAKESLISFERIFQSKKG